MKKLIYSFLLSALLLISCGKNNDTINEPNIPDSKFKGVYIINEGLYGQNNSTISFYYRCGIIYVITNLYLMNIR